jgi:hypothetical protein
MSHPHVIAVDPAHLAAAVSEPPSPPPPYRMVFAEDLTAGMVIEVHREHPRSHDASPVAALQQVLANAGSCGPCWATILDVRSKGGMVAAIVMNDRGEQQHIASHELHGYKVRVDA